MITRIDRPTCRLLRERINESLQTLADELGVEIEAGNASYSGANATFKLLISTKNTDGTVNSKEAENFKVYAYRWGLSPDDLYKTFDSKGETYKITGASPRASRYPILAERVSDSREFKFPADIIKRLLNQ